MTAASTAILVPGPLGGLRMYLRRAGAPKSCLTLIDPFELRSRVRSLDGPRSVVLCGARHRDAVGDAILDLADLYVVPTPWLRRVHPDDLDGRASLAAAVVAAHRARPIEHLRAPQLHLPF